MVVQNDIYQQGHANTYKMVSVMYEL